MKTRLLASTLLAAAAFAQLGCTTTTTTTAQTTTRDPRQGASLDRRVYTQEELQKRGQPTLGGALEAQDASIRVTGGR